MRALILALLFASGCAALPDDGALQCNPNPARACPDGFQCASDGRCYRFGHGPGEADMAVGDNGDMAGGVGADMTIVEACTTSSTCPTGAPVCSPQQMCSSCGTEGSSTECATYHASTPLCGPTGGCVQCFNIDQCESAHQTCDLTTYSCAPCKTNGDCSSGLCNTNTGVCADKTALYYVNNAATAGCTDSGAGSSSVPFCTIQKAVNTSALNGGKAVVVRNGTYSEAVTADPQLVGNINFTTAVVGTGKPVIKPAGAGDAFAVQGRGTLQTNVTLDGFVFDGSTITDTSSALVCNGGSAAYGNVVLTVTNSTMKGAPGWGMSIIAQCKVIADSVVSQSNPGGGLRFDTSDFALTNALVIDNGSASASFGGITITGAGETGKMTIANVTVANNTEGSGASLSAGIGCISAITSTINTVFVGNTGGPSEVDTVRCGTFNNNAFVGGAGSNENLPVSCGPTQLFVDPSNLNFHPIKGGAAPCTLIDLGLTAGAPDHDLDGTPRPQPTGGANDIGAYEAK